MDLLHLCDKMSSAICLVLFLDSEIMRLLLKFVFTRVHFNMYVCIYIPDVYTCIFTHTSMCICTSSIYVLYVYICIHIFT